MSGQGEIYDYLKSLTGDEKGVIPITADGIARQTGHTRDKVSRVLFNLSSRGKIELVRGPNGRAIIGLRHLQSEDGRRRNGGVTIHKVSPDKIEQPVHYNLRIQTPELDGYERAKTKYAQFVREMGDWVESRFDEDPLAEEAIRLKARLVELEPLYAATRRELEAAQRDLRIVKRDRQAELTESALQAGAMVVHSND